MAITNVMYYIIQTEKKLSNLTPNSDVSISRQVSSDDDYYVRNRVDPPPRKRTGAILRDVFFFSLLFPFRRIVI